MRKTFLLFVFGTLVVPPIWARSVSTFRPEHLFFRSDTIIEGHLLRNGNTISVIPSKCLKGNVGSQRPIALSSPFQSAKQHPFAFHNSFVDKCTNSVVIVFGNWNGLLLETIGDHSIWPQGNLSSSIPVLTHGDAIRFVSTMKELAAYRSINESCSEKVFQYFKKTETRWIALSFLSYRLHEEQCQDSASALLSILAAETLALEIIDEASAFYLLKESPSLPVSLSINLYNRCISDGILPKMATEMKKSMFAIRGIEVVDQDNLMSKSESDFLNLSRVSDGRSAMKLFESGNEAIRKRVPVLLAAIIGAEQIPDNEKNSKMYWTSLLNEKESENE